MVGRSATQAAEQRLIFNESNTPTGLRDFRVQVKRGREIVATVERPRLVWDDGSRTEAVTLPAREFRVLVVAGDLDRETMQRLAGTGRIVFHLFAHTPAGKTIKHELGGIVWTEARQTPEVFSASGVEER